MKERPILFSTPMINTIRERRKTQTRRVVKPQPHTTPIANGSASGNYDAWPNGDSCLEWDDVLADTAYYVQAGFCPHGQPGDRLWVRETWQARSPRDYGMECPISQPIEREGYAGHEWTVRYAATDQNFAEWSGWNPSIHMPRWASRITLEVVSVRVERVQDITAEDACAEGVPGCRDNLSNAHAVTWFATLWNQINGKRANCSWQDNPWVWVVEFKEIV
jgi:hypothetical protein